MLILISAAGLIAVDIVNLAGNYASSPVTSLTNINIAITNVDCQSLKY